MKLRLFPFTALALAACGPTLPPAKSVDPTPQQKKLPAPEPLNDLKQINVKEGNVLVLATDKASGKFLAYQVDSATCTARHVFALEPGQVGDLVMRDPDEVSTLNIVRPNPPPPPPGHEELMRYLSRLGSQLNPGQPAACKPFEPAGPIGK
jgi:hypothetical protein